MLSTIIGKQAKLVLAKDFQANFKNVFFLSLMNMKDCHKTRKNPGFAKVFFYFIIEVNYLKA